jgi:isopenicillin-N epimerase
MTSWMLDPDIVHLNHGSFGACPTSVLATQQGWREAMERNPVKFMMKDLQPALDVSRRVLADFVGAGVAGLVFVPNATVGINSVFQSIETHLGPGDEILVTDHTYNACRNIAEVAALRSGATLVEIPAPFPVESAAEIADAVLKRVSAATRLVMIDAVTSPTAIVVPLERLITELEPEIPVLVDAAHAPGMIDLDLESLGASFVVGNCHKWMCAPKATGFLYVRDDRRATVVPATVSHGWNTESPTGGSRFHNLFDWAGTDDPSARLSIPAAIGTMGEMHNDGWPGVMAANRAKVLEGRAMICSALDLPAPVPAEAIGSMATIELPGPHPGGSAGDLDPLTDLLRDRWSIEVPVFVWRDWPHRMLRISAQLYNTPADYERLAEALAQALRL